MKMNISIFLSIFVITALKVITCEFSSSSLVQNSFTAENLYFDPYEDAYLQTMLNLDREALRQIPILDNDTFISELNELNDDMNPSMLLKNPTQLSDQKVDEELLSQRQMEETWEELVVAGPITVNYIGNLMVLSSKKDFAFTRPTPDYVYQHIKYPNSFRTTLVQIANEIYNVFIDAHHKMDSIQLNMQKIPSHLKTILKLLTSASPSMIQSMLPVSLDNIERISKQCADSANSAMRNYQNVTALLNEVTEITVSTYGINTAELNKTNQMVYNSTGEQTLLNSQLAEIRKRYEDARVTLQKAREDYYTEFHAIPTRPKRFLGVLAVGLVGGLVGGTLGCIFSSCGSKAPPPIDNTAFQNAMQKADLALQNLRKAEEQYDVWYTKMLENQNKLAATIMQISQLNMDQIDYETTISILVRATQEVSEIKQQWTNMTVFFTILATRAEATRETVLYEFIKTIKEVTLDSGVFDDANREFFVTLMLETADDIERGAHLLYIMAKTYYDVSSQYMINQISGLSGLAVIQTDSEREGRLKQLSQNTLSTSAKVSRMALERKQQYEQRNHARQDDYKLYIQQLISNELEGSVGK